MTTETRSTYDWRHNLRYNHGISVEQYHAALESQGGVCFICREVCASGNRLGVKINLDTGEIRGLVCKACNSYLKRFTNLAHLERTIAFLRTASH